jgi:acyl dehydratase
MAERIDAQLATSSVHPTVVTFHKLGFRIIKEHADLLGLPSPLKILSEEEAADLFAQDAGGNTVSSLAELERTLAELYAEASGDFQWIHVDVGRARTSPFGATIAPGFLTLSLVSQLSRDAIDVQGNFAMRMNYGVNRVRFPAPLPSGSRIRGRFTVQSVDEVEGGEQGVVLATIEREGADKPVCVAELVVRMMR